MDDETSYEPPAIDEQLPVADPLIVGVYPSPNWQRSDTEDRRPRG